MAKYLSPQWHAAAKELAQRYPERPGASATLAYKVTGGPDGDLEYVQVIRDGRVVDQAMGADADADVTLTITWADGVALATGTLDPNVAFMQGRMKVAGTVGKLMDVLPLTASPEYRTVQAELQALTEY